MKRKEKISAFVSMLSAYAIGSFIGYGLGYMMFGRHSTNHVCQCETCKTIRQLEAVEVVDSIIHDRIVININKED